MAGKVLDSANAAVTRRFFVCHIMADATRKKADTTTIKMDTTRTGATHGASSTSNDSIKK